jgi:MFS family permease
VITFEHGRPYDMLISTALLGVGVGLAFAGLGNLIVQAVEPHQTGAAGGMNTVMRTVGGALGGAISATFIANNIHDGLPTVTGFTDTFAMGTGFLALCTLGAILIPHGRSRGRPEPALDTEPALAVADG